MTTEEIRAAGAAAVADWPPLPEATLDRLATILAPLAEQDPEPATAAGPEAA